MRSQKLYSAKFQPSGGLIVVSPEAIVGFQALMPYKYELETALYIGSHGNISDKAKAEKNFRMTQRLILQRASRQCAYGFGIGSGLTDISIGLRLRYEFNREFTPYIGITYQKSFGKTASFVRQEGGDPSQ